MGARWVRVIGWGGEARGAFTMTEQKIWNHYKNGTDEFSELVIAITVDHVEDVGRDAWVSVGGKRYPIDRYQLRGTIYYLRDDDDPGIDRPMPAGAVPFEKVTSLPNVVRVSGLHLGAG